MFVCFVILILAVGSSKISSEDLCDKTSQPKRQRLCPENEMYVKCRTICPPQSCNISYTEYTCGDETKKCEPGCDCIKNYLRDNDGKCILNDLCPPKIQCGENQVPSDCADNYSADPKITLCQPGCRCTEGYIRLYTDECGPKCGENQVPSDCADDYSANPKITLCQPGCRCTEGFVRNTLNECVQRPPVLDCPVNEEPSPCKQTCPPQECSWDPTKMACKPGPCQPGCNCIEGHLRDNNGNCIPKEKCSPILPQCGKYEEPTDCAKNIGSYDPTLIRCSPCQCIPGYVRDSNGVCVSIPVKCPTKNEIWDPCPSACFSDSCGYKQPKICYTFAINVCQPRCVCKKNFRRNSLGICIPISQCPPQCGKNEEPTDCSYDIVQPFAKDVVSESKIRCLPGCKCIAGYQRDSNGVCVKKEPVTCPGENEELNPCPSPCFTDECGELDEETTACNSFVKPECQPQCRCRANYRRDSTGKCIPKAECPEQPILT